MTHPVDIWTLVGELIDQAGWPGEFDEAREANYRRLLQRWSTRAVQVDGKPTPVLLVAVQQMVDSGQQRFMPSAAEIANVCLAIVGEHLELPPAAEVIRLAEQAAWRAGSESDLVEWMEAQVGGVAAGWLASIGTDRIRRLELAGPYASASIRDLERSYREYADAQRDRHSLGLPVSRAIAGTLERGGRPTAIGQLAQEAGR